MLFVQRDSLVLLAPTISLINVGQFRGHSCFTICREENTTVTHLDEVVINMHDNKLEETPPEIMMTDVSIVRWRENIPIQG